MTKDRDNNDYERDKHRARRNGRSRSRSPRRREHESRHGERVRDGKKYRHADEDGVNEKHRTRAYEPGHPKRTRWDVGDPERGRKVDRMGSHSRGRSPSADRLRGKRGQSPLNKHHEDKHKRNRRSRSHSPSSSDDSSSASPLSRDHSRSNYKQRHSSHRHHRRSPSVSSSSSGSRSRSREHHRRSKHKESKKEKRSRHKEKGKRKRSKSPERRSILTGRKIKMKVRKTAEDHARDASREELLQFLNSTYG